MKNQTITKMVEGAKQRVVEWEQQAEEALRSEIISFLKGKSVSSYKTGHHRYRPIAAIHINDDDKNYTMMDVEFDDEKSPMSRKLLADADNTRKYLLEILEKKKKRITIKELIRYRHGGDSDKERNYFNEVLFSVSGLSIKTWGVFAGVHDVKGHMSKATLHILRQLAVVRDKLKEMEKKVEDIRKAFKQKEAAIKDVVYCYNNAVKRNQGEIKKSFSSLMSQK